MKLFFFTIFMLHIVYGYSISVHTGNVHIIFLLIYECCWTDIKVLHIVQVMWGTFVFPDADIFHSELQYLQSFYMMLMKVFFLYIYLNVINFQSLGFLLIHKHFLYCCQSTWGKKCIQALCVVFYLLSSLYLYLFFCKINLPISYQSSGCFLVLHLSCSSQVLLTSL